MHKLKIISFANLQISEALVHLFGLDVATYLSIASKFYIKSKLKDHKFKMGLKDVSGGFDFSRHKQDSCLAYLVRVGIMGVIMPDNRADGLTFYFKKDGMMELNYIVMQLECIRNFKKRFPKSIVKKNYDKSKIMDKIEKFSQKDMENE